MTPRTFLPLLSTVFLFGCSDGGDGEARFETWGEEYIEQEIPVDEFEDGWSVTYDKFLVVIGDVTLAHADGDQAALADGPRVYDLATAGPHEVGALGALASGNWTAVGYATPAATGATGAHASVGEADLQMMRDQGYSVFASGSATDGTTTKTFAWGFAEPTAYAGCVDVSGGQDVDGIVVPDGGVASVQLTIHGDHLFYDDLQSSEVGLRFSHMAAADADDDGEVTLAELDMVELSSIPTSEGTYGVAANDVNTLGGFVRASTRTLGHFNGEGHCDVSGE